MAILLFNLVFYNDFLYIILFGFKDIINFYVSKELLAIQPSLDNLQIHENMY